MSFKVPADFPSRPVAIIGAGTLGRRIALMFAAHGAAVNIYDLAEEQRRAAVDFVKRELHTMADQHTDQVQGRVSAKADLAEALQDTWLVIEAIPERLELKIQMFGQLDELAPADAILASNSSRMPAGCSWTRSTTPNACSTSTSTCRRSRTLSTSCPAARPTAASLISYWRRCRTSGSIRSKHAERAPASSSIEFGQR